MKITGDGGGLRGFSSYRLHAADERLSVVVMFNHDTNTFSTAISLMEATLSLMPLQDTSVASDGWDGLWLDDERGLIVRLVQDKVGLKLHYSPTVSRPTVGADGVARGQGAAPA